MQRLFYRFALRLGDTLGPMAFHLLAGTVAAVFFIASRQRRRHSLRFYRALYPRRGHGHAVRCAWRQYQSFTTVYLDRWRLQRPGAITHSSQGWHHVTDALAGGRGAILLMSHVGHWELAARLFGTQPLDRPVMLLLGRRPDAPIEELQRQALSAGGLRVEAVAPGDDSPLAVLEAVAFLRRGGLLALTGDRRLSAGTRAVAVRFLGHRAWLPELPHRLALLTGAPLVTFFALRIGPGHYHLQADAPRWLCPDASTSRQALVRRSAQAYAERLEAVLRAHPHQWYHFGPFLERSLEAGVPDDLL
jgi:lauroyl/myristoyl acyltransferase